MTGSSPRSMGTADYIAFHAAARPEEEALVNDGRVITYAEFSRDIAKFAVALRELGLPRGSTVAVGHDDFYVQWLLLLGFERLNVATTSYHATEGPVECAELLAGVDLVLSEAHFFIPGGARRRPITEAWVRDTLARGQDDGPGGAGEAPGDPLRILRSSGTTGRPKRFVITRRMNELRIAGYAGQYQFTRDSRYLLSMPFTVGHIYSSATACIRSGGTVVAEKFAGNADVPRTIAARGITHITLQPLTLKQVLDDLPADFVKPSDLTVGTIGSALSDELSGRALRHLATEVSELFGCNEVAVVSRRRATIGDGFAAVWPSVTVEAIDESGRPVPYGEPGRLRIRTEAMVEGYLDDIEATRRMFKDGWFHPGDMAILDGPRRLKVIGRGDELLNIGGGKMAPEDLEALVMQHIDAGDVGICTFANREGIQELYIAIANLRHDQRDLLARIEEGFKRQQVGFFHVVLLPSIPRSAAGKILRDALKEAVARASGRRFP